MTLKTLGTSKQSPKYRLLVYLEPLPSLIKVGAKLPQVASLELGPPLRVK
jgi:hypothetical protein